MHESKTLSAGHGPGHNAHLPGRGHGRYRSATTHSLGPAAAEEEPRPTARKTPATASGSGRRGALLQVTPQAPLQQEERAAASHGGEGDEDEGAPARGRGADAERGQHLVARHRRSARHGRRVLGPLEEDELGDEGSRIVERVPVETRQEVGGRSVGGCSAPAEGKAGAAAHAKRSSGSGIWEGGTKMPVKRKQNDMKSIESVPELARVKVAPTASSKPTLWNVTTMSTWRSGGG